MQNSITIKQLLAESSPVDRHTRQQWLLHCLNQPLGYLISHGDDTLSDKVLATIAQGWPNLPKIYPWRMSLVNKRFGGMNFWSMNTR
ncbi:hypothetical protein [Moraxella atlantae]|uniref:hypothetical protein n=1 Tax=Faucicola atlantae TaxID=34059 RepID=UPI0011C070D5|nr:hypothetical protein [Moraxella atlantae]